MEKKIEPEEVAGLSEEDASKSLKEAGYNELPSQKKQGFFSIMFNILREPMLLLLLGSGLIYLFVVEINDAMMLLFFVFLLV